MAPWTARARPGAAGRSIVHACMERDVPVLPNSFIFLSCISRPARVLWPMRACTRAAPLRQGHGAAGRGCRGARDAAGGGECCATAGAGAAPHPRPVRLPATADRHHGAAAHGAGSRESSQGRQVGCSGRGAGACNLHVPFPWCTDAVVRTQIPCMPYKPLGCPLCKAAEPGLFMRSSTPPPCLLFLSAAPRSPGPSSGPPGRRFSGTRTWRAWACRPWWSFPSPSWWRWCRWAQREWDGLEGGVGWAWHCSHHKPCGRHWRRSMPIAAPMPCCRGSIRVAGGRCIVVSEP